MSTSKFIRETMQSIDQELQSLAPLQHKRTTRRPQFARLKMCMKYTDRNDSYHYSYDYFKERDPDGTVYYRLDEREGMAYLKREIKKQMYKGNVQTAYIYISFVNTNTLDKNYDFEIFHWVKGKPDIEAPYKFHQGNQTQLQTKPREARYESNFNMADLFLWFRAFGFHQLVDDKGKLRPFPKKW